MGTRNWPVLIPIPRKYSLRGSRSILFYRSLEEMRGPVLKKTLNRKCRVEEMLVDDTTSNSRSNWTFESVFLIDSIRIIINLVNSWKLLLHSIKMRGVFLWKLELFGKYWEWESAYCLINCIFCNQISEMGISCTTSSLTGNFKFAKTSLIF